MIVGFIVISTAIFLAIGRPVTILIAVGALNAFVLPSDWAPCCWPPAGPT